MKKHLVKAALLLLMLAAVTLFTLTMYGLPLGSTTAKGVVSI